MSKATYDKIKDQIVAKQGLPSGPAGWTTRPVTVESQPCAPATRTGPRKGSLSGIAIGSGGYSPYGARFRVSLIGSRPRGQTPP
jgi:hypothetical protein